MDGNNNHSENRSGGAISCDECRSGLQEYLDGTQDKKESLRFFLHLRECASCQVEHDHLQGLFQMLDSLPAREAPADFDQAVLASVPLEAYRAMEPLRRERVPVFLEESFLPAVLRSPSTRLAGLVATAACVGTQAFLGGPNYLIVPALMGALPEILVRLQGLGRRVVTSARAES